MAMFYENMSIDTINFTEYIKVDKAMVDKWEELILSELQNNSTIDLIQLYSKINNQELVFSRNNFEEKLEEYMKEVSDCIAFQEALIRLMNKGKAMPIKSLNTCDDTIVIRYQENNGMSTYSGTRHFKIPTIPFQTFMLAPSELYKR